MLKVRPARLWTFFTLGFACLAVVLLEGLFRISLDPVSAGMNAGLLRHSDFFQRDQQLGWIPRPHVVGAEPYENRMIPFRTNSQGWRDREYPLTPARPHTRMAVFGDGFTWGTRVRDQEIYTEVLESMLEQTDVINLGVPGYAVGQEIEYFKRAALPYRPDTVLLAFTMDNIYEADGKLIQLDLNRLTHSPSNTPVDGIDSGESPVLRIKRYLQMNSALYRWGREQLTTNKSLVRLLSRAGLREPLGGVEHLSATLQPALKQPPESIASLMVLAETKLLEFHSLLMEQGVRFIIVLIPSKASVDRLAFDQAIALTTLNDHDFDLERPYRRLEEFAALNQIELINPINRFRKLHTADNPLYLTHDEHFSPKGHEVLAEEIYRYLTQDPTYLAHLTNPHQELGLAVAHSSVESPLP